MEPHLRNLLLVAAGGAVGSASRYAVGQIVQTIGWMNTFPLGTLVVNIAGCFLIGIATGLSESSGIVTPATRLFVVTGVLGGFTTFSAFGNETVLLARTGNFSLAFINVLLSILAGLGAVLAGFGTIRLFFK